MVIDLLKPMDQRFICHELSAVVSREMTNDDAKFGATLLLTKNLHMYIICVNTVLQGLPFLGSHNKGSPKEKILRIPIPILDMGCGDGAMLRKLLPISRVIFAVEIKLGSILKY